METVKRQLAAASKAYASLRAVSTLRVGEVERRDIAILRFMYSFESVVSAARLYLSRIEGIDTNSPKSCARSSFEVGLLTTEETEIALLMADDRNLTAHTYNEEQAKDLYARLPRHVDVLGAWLKAMKARVAKRGGRKAKKRASA